MSKQLSASSIKKLERQVATINQWPELELRDFLEDHPDKALAMALTLKHYANPLGGYPRDSVAEEAIKNIISCLADPTKLEQKSSESLNKDEKEYLIQLLRSKLDKLANDVIADKKFSADDIRAAMEKAVPKPPLGARELTPEEKEERYIENWWNSLTPAQQKAIEKRHKNLNTKATFRPARLLPLSLLPTPRFVLLQSNEFD